MDKQPYTKEMQVGKVKKGEFGKKKSSIKKRSIKVQKEKSGFSNYYYDWIHSSGQVCAICSADDIDIHHITDIHQIDGKRRVWNRVIPLCKAHHKGDSIDRYNGKAIHRISKENWYKYMMSLEDMIKYSDSMYEEFRKS